MEIKDVRKEHSENGPIIITIVIAEGPQYHVSKISISGEKATTEAKHPRSVEDEGGQRLFAESAARRCEGDCRMPTAAAVMSISWFCRKSAPAGPARIDVHYKIEEGDRSFLQRINIAGNTRTKDKVIRREVLVAPGRCL